MLTPSDYRRMLRMSVLWPVLWPVLVLVLVLVPGSVVGARPGRFFVYDGRHLHLETTSCKCAPRGRYMDV